jgi:hypothetical protein
MNKENLTPLEKFTEARHEHAIFRAAVFATLDLIEVSKECNLEISAWIEDPAGMDEMVVEEARKDSIITDHAIVVLATTMEERFGISA